VKFDRRPVPDEYDQVLRLDRFRQVHPAVIVGAGNRWWQAVIPEPDGEIVTTWYTLRALLDKLDELLNANPGRPRQDLPWLAGIRLGCDIAAAQTGNHPLGEDPPARRRA
jgi:hypothetical protein